MSFAKQSDLKEVAAFGRSLVGDSHIDLETLEVRYKINPQIVTCLFKETDNTSSRKLIGYYILYPLTSEAYDEIHRTDIINGRGIKEEHICPSFLDATVLYIGMAGGEAGHATGFVIEEMIEQVGLDNNGPYKQEYPKILVNDSGEELVSVSEYGLVSSDFYLNEYLQGKSYLESAVSLGYLRTSAYLRKGHVLRLQRVDKFLREYGYFLHIQSGWRHPKLQTIIKNEFSRINGDDKANRMFATVIDGAAPPPHATGAAFDLEIRKLSDGMRQELYYSFKGKHVYSAYQLEQLAITSPKLKSNKVFKEVLENRRVLFHALCTLGVVFKNKADLFTSHPGECWHFGDGDSFARYGFIELPNISISNK